jgi:hypothetical protein
MQQQHLGGQPYKNSLIFLKVWGHEHELYILFTGLIRYF